MKKLFIIMLVCFPSASLFAQKFDYRDTMIHDGGRLIYTNFDKWYGQLKVDSNRLGRKVNHMRCYPVGGVSGFGDKKLNGKCLLYWNRRSTDKTGKACLNDTNRVARIYYMDENGKDMRYVLFNKEGEVTLIQGFLNGKRLVEWCNEEWSQFINPSYIRQAERK